MLHYFFDRLNFKLKKMLVPFFLDAPTISSVELWSQFYFQRSLESPSSPSKKKKKETTVGSPDWTWPLMLMAQHAGAWVRGHAAWPGMQARRLGLAEGGHV